LRGGSQPCQFHEGGLGDPVEEVVAGTPGVGHSVEVGQLGFGHRDGLPGCGAGDQGGAADEVDLAGVGGDQCGGDRVGGLAGVVVAEPQDQVVVEGEHVDPATDDFLEGCNAAVDVDVGRGGAAGR